MEPCINIEDDKTHRSLIGRGSIINPRYHKRETILASNDTALTVKTEKKEDNVIEKREVWESCCFKLNPHGVAYFGQFTVSILVLGISTYMLIKADGDCNKSSPYIGIISFLLGKILSSVVSST